MVVLFADDGARRDDLVIPQGSAWSRTWPVTDSTGAPLTVTGYAVRAQARSTDKSPVVLFEWNTTPGGGIGVATASGTNVTIALTGADSALFAWRTAVYDAFITSPSGQPTKIVVGSVRITPSVTR